MYLSNSNIWVFHIQLFVSKLCDSAQTGPDIHGLNYSNCLSFQNTRVRFNPNFKMGHQAITACPDKGESRSKIASYSKVKTNFHKPLCLLKCLLLEKSFFQPLIIQMLKKSQIEALKKKALSITKAITFGLISISDI